MHEVQGVFCKTGKLWIIAKIRRQGKTLYGPKLRQAQQKKTKGGALGCGLTQWALARSVVRWTGWAAVWHGRRRAGSACSQFDDEEPLLLPLLDRDRTRR